MLTSLAQIAISVVMLRGGVFGRVAAWAGISGFALLLIFTGWTTLVPGALEGALLVALPAGLLVVAALWRILYRR